MVSYITVRWRWLKEIFLNGCSSCTSSPSYVTYNPSHRGPQRRVSLHHPTNSVAVWLIMQGLLDLGGTDGGCVQPNSGTELSDDLTHGPHIWTLVPLTTPLQHLWSWVGFIPHVHSRVETISEEFGQSQVNDYCSVCVMFHLKEKYDFLCMKYFFAKLQRTELHMCIIQ